MVADSEKFAEEDEIIKKKIEARNALENFIYSLKGQLADDKGLGGKLESADKKTVNDEIKKSQDWLEEFSATATAEDYDEQREALQSVVSPITSKVVSFFFFFLLLLFLFFLFFHLDACIVANLFLFIVTVR